MKCDKCGYDDKGTGDFAHICGPVNIKKSPMNLQTVITNLKNTIAGKEMLLEKYQSPTAVREMLAINVDELKRILQDVEQCIGVEE